MKKTYLQPRTEILRIQPVKMIAESLVVGPSTGSGDPSTSGDNGGWAREESDWDIW